MATLEDGTGTGNSATIDDKHRLWTYSTTVEEYHIISETNGLYFTLCNAPAGHLASDGWQLYLQNDSSDKLLHVQSIHFSPTQIGYFHVGRNGEVDTGTVIAPVNMNFSSNVESPSFSYYGSPITYKVGKSPAFVLGGLVPANTKYNEVFNGSVILGYKSAISLYWKWTGTAGVVGMGIQFYFK